MVKKFPELKKIVIYEFNKHNNSQSLHKKRLIFMHIRVQEKIFFICSEFCHTLK